MSDADKARLAALEKENADLKADQAKQRTQGIRNTNASFVEALVQEGKLLPVYKDVCAATLNYLETQESVVEFGEGDAKQPVVKQLKEFLGKLPKQVEFKELGGGAEGDDVTDPSTIAAKAAEFIESEAKAGRTINAAAAVQHVMKGVNQ
jgi:hypothetical protein